MRPSASFEHNYLRLEESLFFFFYKKVIGNLRYSLRILKYSCETERLEEKFDYFYMIYS